MQSESSGDGRLPRQPSVQELHGLWRRSLIAWPDGARDVTTNVRWLQGLSAYIDLRQPASLPKFPDKQRVSDLSMEDCALLATQEGFAGQFTFDGSYFEWARAIDFQPKALYSDAGSLWWEDDILVETGRDVAYIEHWHREATVGPLAAAAAALRQVDCDRKGSLLRVGSIFMFARDRAILPQSHKTLPECVAEASSLEQAQALVDCEISFGNVCPEGLLITASSLPYRVGNILAPHILDHTLTTTNRAPDGNTTTHQWEITGCEGELHLLDADRAAFKCP